MPHRTLFVILLSVMWTTYIVFLYHYLRLNFNKTLEADKRKKMLNKYISFGGLIVIVSAILIDLLV